MSYCAKCGCETTRMATCPVCDTPVENGFEDAYAFGSQTVAAGASDVFDANGEPIPTFVGAFARFWKKYADGKSRASRTEFWYVTIWQMMICPLLLFGAVACAAASSDDGDPRHCELGSVGGVCGLMVLVYMFASLIPFLNLVRRRLHDFNASGWWVLPYPFYFEIAGLGGWVHLILGCIPPTKGTNKYGPPPRPRKITSKN